MLLTFFLVFKTERSPVTEKKKNVYIGTTCMHTHTLYKYKQIDKQGFVCVCVCVCVFISIHRYDFCFFYFHYCLSVSTFIHMKNSERL